MFVSASRFQLHEQQQQQHPARHRLATLLLPPPLPPTEISAAGLYGGQRARGMQSVDRLSVYSVNNDFLPVNSSYHPADQPGTV
jgi:hypothetical protein